MDRKRHNSQKNDHCVQAKKKLNADFEVQCELGTNIYRLALKRQKKSLPLSSSFVEATEQIRSISSCIEHSTPKQKGVIPNVDDESITIESPPSSPESIALVDLLPRLSSSSSSNVCGIQPNNNNSADVQLLSVKQSALTTAVVQKPHPLEDEAIIMSDVTERSDSIVKSEEPFENQIQKKTHTNTFRSNRFGSANFQWLREINFNSISANLFIDMEAEYAQVIRAQFIGELKQLKNTKRAVSFIGQNPDTILKIIVINSNEYFQVLCTLRAFLTRHQQPNHVIETPLHFIFCHLFVFQSDFRKLRTSEGKGVVAHEIYFFAS